MEWFIFALLAPIIFAVCNIIDKYVLTKKLKDPTSYNILALSLNVIPLATLPFFIRISLGFSAFLAIVNGFVLSGMFIIYNKAIMKEEATRIISLMYTQPIFVALFSLIILGEQQSLQKYLGIIILIASAILISYNRTKGKFHLSYAILLILIYAVMSSLMKILTKYALYNVDYWGFFFWSIVGNFIGISLLVAVPLIRRRLTKQVIKLDKRTWLFILASDVFWWFGSIIFFIALSIGYVSLTVALMSIQPLAVFILTLILTIHRPKVLREEISRGNIILKLLAIILIFIGSYLIVI